MDRSYEAPDRVHCYASMDALVRGEPPVKIASVVPHSRAGLVWYEVDGKIYPGYVGMDSGEVRVFLDGPEQGLVR